MGVDEARKKRRKKGRPHNKRNRRRAQRRGEEVGAGKALTTDLLQRGLKELGQSHIRT